MTFYIVIHQRHQKIFVTSLKLKAENNARAINQALIYSSFEDTINY